MCMISSFQILDLHKNGEIKILIQVSLSVCVFISELTGSIGSHGRRVVGISCSSG